MMQWCCPCAHTSYQTGEPNHIEIFFYFSTLCPIILQYLLDIGKSDYMFFPQPKIFPKLLLFFSLHLSPCFFHFHFWKLYKFPGSSAVKNRHRFNPWMGKLPWRKEWLPTPVFLPGEFHGQRSLAIYSPWDHKELDKTEWLTFTFSPTEYHFALLEDPNFLC